MRGHEFSKSTKSSSSDLWDVIEKLLGSDHLAILINLFINVRAEGWPRQRLATKKIYRPYLVENKKIEIK